MKSRSNGMAIIAAMVGMMPGVSYLLNSGMRIPVRKGGKARRLAASRFRMKRGSGEPGDKMRNRASHTSRRGCDGTMRGT